MIGCAFAAGCILLMPQELIGAGIAFALAGVLAVWHLVRLRKERDMKALPQAGAPEPH